MSLKGTWTRDAHGNRVYAVETGASLIWCPKTKALMFDGPVEAAIDFGSAVLDAMQRITWFGGGRAMRRRKRRDT